MTPKEILLRIDEEQAAVSYARASLGRAQKEEQTAIRDQITYLQEIDAALSAIDSLKQQHANATLAK